MISVPDPPPETGKIISQFLRGRLEESGCEGFVIGLSGGLDSALVLHLASLSVGRERVHPIFLPNGSLSSSDRPFAESAADSAGCDLVEIDIAQMLASAPVRGKGAVDSNLQARIRMLVLYSIANRDHHLVLGTSNKSELMLGYFTKYGDGGSDLCPIGDLLKTQARALARSIEVPLPIIDRPPTAGLVAGQTDEGDLGMPYPILDRIIIGYLRGYPPERVLELIDISLCTEEEMTRSGLRSLNIGDVERIYSSISRARHKRDPLIIPKIGPDTIGVDLRERW